MKICQNIDLVELQLRTNADDPTSYGLEYYFPKNVSWAGKKIDKIVVAVAEDVSPNRQRYSATAQSPLSGGSILARNGCSGFYTSRTATVTTQYPQGLYFDIYTGENQLYAKDLYIDSLSSLSPYQIEINDVLDLEHTMLHIPTKLHHDGSLMVYVFWGGHEDPNFVYPTRNIAVTFTLDALQKMSLQELINTYVHIQPNKIRGIYNYTRKTPIRSEFGRPGSGVFLTLRDYNNTYIVNNVHDVLFSGASAGENYKRCSRNHLYFDADICFDNSYVVNAFDEESAPITLVFEY